MCQKCTAPGPATGSLYLTISQTVLSAKREKGKGRKRECVCCAVHAQVLQLFWGPETTHTMHTHYTPHTTAHTGCSLIGWFFCTLLLFVSMIWQQTFAWLKRKALPPWGYSLSHTSLHAPFGLGNFWLCWLLDKLPTAATRRRRRRLWSKLFALQTSVRIRVRFALLVIVVFAHLLPPLSLLLLCCQALTSDARFPRHRWPVSKRHCQ